MKRDVHPKQENSGVISPAVFFSYTIHENKPCGYHGYLKRRMASNHKIWHWIRSRNEPEERKIDQRQSYENILKPAEFPFSTLLVFPH